MKGETANPNALLRPGMFANLSLKLGTFESALLIPDSSLMMERDKIRVYVIKDNNSAEIREVKIEKVLKGQVLVSSGLKPGEQVVAQGYQKLFPGASVKVSRWLGEDREGEAGEQNKS